MRLRNSVASIPQNTIIITIKDVMKAVHMTSCKRPTIDFALNLFVGINLSAQRNRV